MVLEIEGLIQSYMDKNINALFKVHFLFLQGFILK